MIGIYKITSPSGRVYIGQSISIEKRFNAYKSINCKDQTRLYRSLLKYGVDKHKFEVVVECEENQLNDLERYYQDLYNVVDEKGLNCRLTNSYDRSGKLSEETIKRKSESVQGLKNPMFGKSHTEEVKILISLKNKGRIQSDEEKLKRSESRKIFYELNHGPWKGKKGGKAPNAKKVINIKTNIIFDSLVDASQFYGIKYHTLKPKLNGRRKNNTLLKYL